MSGAKAVAHAPGSLVRTRGRDWVVLPSREVDVLKLRPLTGGESETIGVYLPLEERTVTSTSFAPPDMALAGDTVGAGLLLDAARLSLRSGAAPFRSLGRISVVPRPYQLVPLVMALRLDPVRLLIADDVGVGKTIEALLIARELLDRGIARRIGVICPASLCDQWQREMSEKFALEAIVVQPSRIARLERDLPRPDLSIYDYYPHLVASIDFVKSDKNRAHFARSGPDLIIVDEAHGAARPRGDRRQVEQQRYDFLRELTADPSRHVLLVTATPHSGVEESFRSLLGLLDPAFDRADGELDTKRLLRHMVQRRRSDVEHWLGEDTPFPKRVPAEKTYSLSAPYRALFEDVVAYCRESVQIGARVGQAQQRVRYWAAIALLRCVLSSPAAAVAVLERRRGKAGDATPLDDANDVDAAFLPQVLDGQADETPADYVPAAPLEMAEANLNVSERRRLSGFLQRANELAGPENDRKLAAVASAVSDLLATGFRPIVFCRFIPTAKYLETWLPKLLLKDFPGLVAKAVTGELGDDERRVRVAELANEERRVLVATDCLSEGINLQDHFDAVLHYDLPWNPNRLEQREGRVDRFGQPAPEVRAVILHGSDNEVDLVVREVLIRKARLIRKRLNVSVPVPAETEQVVQAVVNTILLRGPRSGVQLQLALESPEVNELHRAMDQAADREEKQRAYFAQHAIKPDEIAQELRATDAVLGDPATVQRFLANAAQRFRGELRSARKPSTYELTPGVMSERLALRGFRFPLPIVFDRLKDPAAEFVGRTHSITAAYADAVIGAALAPGGSDLFSRVGATYTDAASVRTGVALLRIRYVLRERDEDEFAEEIVLAAFERNDDELRWIEPLEERARALLEATRPLANMPLADRQAHVQWALGLLEGEGWFAPLVDGRVKELQESHQRLRKLTRAGALTVRPHIPPDVLGCYVLVPIGRR